MVNNRTHTNLIIEWPFGCLNDLTVFCQKKLDLKSCKLLNVEILFFSCS